MSKPTRGIFLQLAISKEESRRRGFFQHGTGKRAGLDLGIRHKIKLLRGGGVPFFVPKKFASRWMGERGSLRRFFLYNMTKYDTVEGKRK